jgi:clan AA aspartic protease (TIGR02281 family)
MRILAPMAAIVTVLSLLAGFASSQQMDGGGDAQQLIAQWQATDATCRSPQTAAIAAIGACEQRDVFSKLLTLQRYCHRPSESTANAGWAPCGPDAAALQAASRTTAQFQRMGGVFLLPATVNGSTNVYFIVDSGATNVQIPEDIAEQMKQAGTLTEADFLGQRRFILADGSGVNQRIFRLRNLKIGNRSMENVLAALSAPRSRPLLGQSFLRRLEWWKIDNVKNSIEFEFTGAF